jgi:hypothetical protein
MREGLREVANLALECRIVFLRQQADIVGKADESVEQQARILDAPA